jgi:tagatose-6-phosphate ketose/aldose isomerase
MALHPDQAITDASWTRREILQQPETLRATQALLLARREDLSSFLHPRLANPALRIVLTGAGSSSFIGASLAPHLAHLLGRPVEAIATTDLVSAPHVFFDTARPTLLISFGRSGNSPESLAAIDLAEARLSAVWHLILTCNKEGALAELTLPNAAIVVLPDATHDRGFAMTSSFTAMLYAALAILTGADKMQDRLDAIARAVSDALVQTEPRAAVLAQAGFQRIVYLGSGVLEGLAREASLKLMEMTDGAIVTFAGTPMAFRHGPKTIVNARTLVVVFLSNHALTRRYDLDLVEELRRDGESGSVIAVSAQDADGDAMRIPGMAQAEDADLLFPFIVPAQFLALHASLHLGLTPDQPSVSGTVNRVVQGVRIHSIDA